MQKNWQATASDVVLETRESWRTDFQNSTLGSDAHNSLVMVRVSIVLGLGFVSQLLSKTYSLIAQKTDTDFYVS